MQHILKIQERERNENQRFIYLKESQNTNENVTSGITYPNDLEVFGDIEVNKIYARCRKKGETTERGELSKDFYDATHVGF